MPYMQYPIIQTYYSGLKKHSLENDVDFLWINILGLYFTVAKNYGLEHEARPLEKNKQRADLTIRYVKNGVPKKVILIEDKRVESEAQTAVWTAAVEQMESYLKLVRTEPESSDTLYAIVTVGHYSRFYLLEPGASELKDYPGTNGKPLEFKNNEKEIEAILNELVAKTS